MQNARRQLNFKEMLTRRKNVSVLTSHLLLTQLFTLFCPELRSKVEFGSLAAQERIQNN